MILIDTREQQNWNFVPYGYTQSVQTLKTGDYTFAGYEDLICIERKKSVSELAINIGSDWVRFHKELVRMHDYKYKYIICEFPVSDINNFPASSDIPKIKWASIRIKPAFILKRIEEIQDLGIEIFFCHSKSAAEQLVIDLYEEIKAKESR